MLLKDEKLLKNTTHAYNFLKEKCFDEEYGGVYWSLDYKGEALDSTKHSYNQAFAIYALCAYYEASKDEEALDLAKSIYNTIETMCRDAYGYRESFNRCFEPEDNDKLSENGVMAEKTMNTLLHIFEAYTQLYKVDKDEAVKKRLEFILDTVSQKVFNKSLGRQEVFFDNEWNTLTDLYSYGHDIETAWLLDLGLEIINSEKYFEKISPITAELEKNIYKRAYINHSLINETHNGKTDTTRVWWVQAEAVVGFYNAYQKTGDIKYLHASKDIWEFIKTYIIDKRNGSEWYWSVDENGNPYKKPIIEAWKCPYHNGRMCFEIIRRINAS